MRKTALSFIGIFILLLVAVPLALATSTVTISDNQEGATSNVNITTNTGNNTVCVDGKCTTSSEKTGKSTVCINGTCQTSDGDIKAESSDGKAKVNIQTNEDSKVVIEQKSGGSVSNKVEVNHSKKADTATDKGNQKNTSNSLENNKFDLGEFIRDEMEFLRKLVTFQFLF